MSAEASLETRALALDAPRRDRVWWGVGALLAVLLFAFAVLPELAPHGSTEIFAGQQLKAPSGEHLFGTDVNRMDVFSRVLVAARVDLGIALASTLLAFVVGFPLGLVSGYFTGLGANAFLRVLDMVQAFPMLILALAIVAIAGPGAGNIIIAQVFVATPIMIRVVRADVVRLREERFVEAAVATGNSDLRLLVRHLAPHALPVALVQATILASGVLVITAGLSFVGVGVSPPEAEWGAMIGLGSKDIANGDWWTIVFPGLAIVVTVLLFNVLGHLLRRHYGGERLR